MNVMRSNIVAALTLTLRIGLFAAVLAMSTAGASGATSVSGQSSAQKSPQLTLSVPTTATTGARVLATGKATRVPHGASVILQRQNGKRWVQLGRSAVSHGKYKVSFTAPTGAVVVDIRIVLVKGRRRLATSAVRKLRLHAVHLVRRGAGPAAAPVSPSRPSNPPSTSSPLVVFAPGITVAIGSVGDVVVPGPLMSVTSIEGAVAGAESGVAVVAQKGLATISASAQASTGKMTLTFSGKGCTASGCGVQYTMSVPLTVAPIAALPGPVETLSIPSPDRVAAAVNHQLVDELEATIGTPEAPGTRAQAEADAAAVEGVVAGGLEASGVYQIRWSSPQDLAARTAELEARPDVTSVSPATVDLYHASSAYPVAPEFESPQWTWPYQQVHATEAWAKANGSNVTVGIIDEGNVLANHEDLNVTEIIGGYEPKFHATHVAGLACAKNNSVGMVGLASGCPIVSVGGGTGSIDAVLNDMHEMTQRANVKVVNMSIGTGPKGGGCASPVEQAEIEEIIDKEKGVFGQFFAGAEGQKIVWTFAAGNNCAPGAASGMAANAQLSNVISVAATNSDSTLAVFSNYGPGVEVAAPGGVNVQPQTYGLISTATEGECPPFDSCPVACFWEISANCGAYKQDMGTSMAAPIVAGIVALVRSANPQLSADQAGTCVTSSAGTGETQGRSTLPDEPYEEWEPHLPYTGSIPIVNAARAVECAPRGTASSYKGGGGGDGWGIALTQDAVYNVFHHDPSLQIACHFQATAMPCWEGHDPETITDTEGHGFASSGQPGIWFDHGTGKLYVFATRTSDGTAGVVCVDTAEAAANPDPFCGFTALTGVGEAPIAAYSISAVSDPALVGSRWYAFNYVAGSRVEGAKNKLLCFDVQTLSACSGQPFALSAPAGESNENLDFPPPAVLAIGAKVIVPVTFGSTEQLDCFDGNAEQTCPGSWPVTPPPGYASRFGAAFPLLNGAGALAGLCLPTGADPCYGLAGESVATPPKMSEAITANLGWNGPGLVHGTRVYVPNAEAAAVDCYDYGTSTPCAGYPHALQEMFYLYTVNTDPERPNCIWVNSDSGEGQIQNFDAYTGGTCE